MARVDSSRDYYADLELGAGASADDVKKQYRKLGNIISTLKSQRSPH